MSDSGRTYESGQRIADRCPSCGHATLFIGTGGWITCSWLACKEPGLSRAIQALKANHGAALNAAAERVHEANKSWWRDLETGAPKARNVGELLMLCTSELAEAMEGHRKNLPDDKLPHRSMFEVELADCIIRILDIAGGMGLDIGGAFEEKMAYNARREDHKVESRLKDGGKKY